MRTALLPVVLAVALVGCRDAAQDPSPTEVAVRIEAPGGVVHTESGPVSLASLHGTPVVLQFAEADDADAWAALADAAADLEASGAVVLTVETDGDGAETAEAFGYEGRPLVVVVDGEGTLRGSAEPTSGDAVFALVAPVLAEADLAQTVAWEGADTMEELTAIGGVIVDLGSDPDAFPYALRIALDALSVDALPADLGTPLAFVGDGAEEAARRAVSWGYAAVHVAGPAGEVHEVEAERPPLDDWQPGRRGVRG